MRDRPKEKNLEHALGMIDSAPQSDLTLLREIWPCGFFSFDRNESEGEIIDGPLVTAFEEKAHENPAFLISCNCAGANQGKEYAGHSMIVDPLGRVVAEHSDEEEFVSARIDPESVDTVRQDFPALDARDLS
jgi:predicted amidohydrolase